MIVVVNKYKHESTEDDVYIGRGSLFGNPYSHLPSKKEDVVMCKDREESIDRFEEYFNNVIDSPGCKHTKLKRELRRLVMIAKLGGDINLSCFCKPKSCHGDIIKEWIEEEIEKY